VSVNSYDDLIAHKGHKIVCVTYGPIAPADKCIDVDNVSLECEDCNEVLLSYDKEETRTHRVNKHGKLTVTKNSHREVNNDR